VAISFADPSKAKRLLGWDATLGLDRMVADTWRWQSRNPTGFREAAPSAAAAAVVAVAEKPVGRV
jgi:UDP-glucose 4-epimerase